MANRKGKKKAKKERRAASKAAGKAAERATLAKIDELTLRAKQELDAATPDALFAPTPPKEECPICFLPVAVRIDDHCRYMVPRLRSPRFPLPVVPVASP